MELDLEGQHADRAYAILASLVIPRPIAWVTTLSPDGAVNAAPFSFFNVLGTTPPIVGFCPGDRDDGQPKDTARNVRLTHEFVVNLVDERVAQAMNQTSASLGYGEDELASGWPHRPPIVCRAAPQDRRITSEFGVRRMGNPANWR